MTFQFYNPQVAVQPVGGPDVGAPAEMLANKLDQFSKSSMQLRQQLVTSRNIQAGEEAGAKIGFKPLKENTPQDIIYNKAAMQAQKSMIQNRIRNASLQFRQDAIQNLHPGSLNDYDSRMQAFSQETVNQVSKPLQQYTKNMINYYGFTNRSPVQLQVKNLNNNMLRSNLQVGLNNTYADAA